MAREKRRRGEEKCNAKQGSSPPGSSLGSSSFTGSLRRPPQGDCPGIAEDTGAGWWLAYVHQFKVRGTHGPSPSRGSVSVRGTEIHPSADV